MDLKKRVDRFIYVASFFKIDNKAKVFFKEIGETLDANAPIVITVENWEEHKYTFKEQRFNQIKYLHLTEQERIECEIEELLKLSNNLSKTRNFSNKRKNEIIILSRRYKNLLQSNPDGKAQTKSEKKIETNTKLSHKWYALYYWIKLNAYGDLPPTTPDGDFNKKEIQLFGKTLIEDFEKDIKTTTTGQGFYKQFRSISDNLNDEKILKFNFPNWKEFIKKLSKNDKMIIKYMEDKYPS